MVVPCFNEEKRFDQEYFDHLTRIESTEWLFVDDGSKDATLSVLSNFCRRSNTNFLHLPKNVGKSEALRIGMLQEIEKDSGAKWIGFLDSDGAFSVEDVNEILTKIMKDEFEISIPKSLEGISLRQYQEYLKMYDKWDKEDETYFKTKVLQIFCGLNIEDTYKIPVVEFNSVIEHVLECFKEETPLIKKFYMTGKNKVGEDVKVNFGFIPKLDDISFGEFIDLEKYMFDNKNYHKAMAVLYRPIVEKKNKFYSIFIFDEYTRHIESSYLKFPKFSICDPTVITSLPERQIQNGNKRM